VPKRADTSTGVTAESIGTHEKGVKIISSQLLKSSLVTWSIGSGQGDGWTRRWAANLQNAPKTTIACLNMLTAGTTLFKAQAAFKTISLLKRNS
jgi:hypothetical protein